MSEIVMDRTKLKIPCEPVTSLEEGMEIANRLIQILDRQSNAVGLAANQAGINKQVCVIRVDRTLILINPEIVDVSGEISYTEGCLSFPNEQVATKRFFSISVKADNYKEIQSFIPNGPNSLLECVCIQHEVDHLMGLTMHDRAREDV